MTETKSVEKSVKKPAAKPASEFQVAIYDLAGKELKTIDLSKKIFDIEYNPQLVAQYIRVYRANQRQGNASTKTRAEVIGTTKKIYRQKGTGNARHGSKKAPIFVGGGVVGGPLPTDHSLSFNKKQRKIALFGSLSYKAKQKAIVGLSNDVMDMKTKTKDVAAFLKTMKIDGKKVVIVVPEMKKNGFLLSSRNLANVELIQAANLNPYVLMNNKVAVIVEGSFEKLEKHFVA